MECRSWALLATSWAVYGTTSFVGGLASKHVQNPFVVLYCMLLGRVTGGLVACGIAFVRTLREGESRVLTLPRVAIVPFLLPAVGNVGWVTYFLLTRGGEVSLVAPLMSLYIAIPVTFATVVLGAPWSVTKGLGTVGVIASCALLAVSSAVESSPDGKAWLGGDGCEWGDLDF